jgi:hypothetical protein
LSPNPEVGAVPGDADGNTVTAAGGVEGEGGIGAVCVVAVDFVVVEIRHPEIGTIPDDVGGSVVAAADGVE